ncbi:MAG: peptidylprolyl isomerase, partial [Salinisphaera sp.]|nr:peptidylprolyl isomerase [Salinisphaera sp.]
LATLRAQGAPVNEMRGKLRDRLLMDKLRQKAVLGRVVVTDKDVDRYLESQSLRVQKDLEYHILHMLIAVDSGASAQAVANARERMQALRKKALGDASFRELAIAYSDGQNALQGGDLGWLRGGFLPTLFADVVPQLKKGEVSPIFRGRSGFHLIKLDGIRSISGDVAPDKAIVEEVKLRQILLKPNEIRDDKRAKKQLQDLRTRLQAGDDFAELARQYSDASSASKGGDMGWLQVKQLPPTLAKQIQQLKPNQTSEPFETPPGWQIIRLEGRRQRDLSEELRRQHARQAIGRRKMAQAGQRWLREMREDAYVDIRMKDYVNNKP